MTKDECDHLDAGINQAFRDGAVFFGKLKVVCSLSGLICHHLI